MVVADPAFGDPPLIAGREKSDGASGVGASNRIRIDYSQVFFGPLPGVNDEVRALGELLPNASFLTRERATKAALQGVVAPSILHIATHGFFLSEPGATGSVAITRSRLWTRVASRSGSTRRSWLSSTTGRSRSTSRCRSGQHPSLEAVPATARRRSFCVRTPTAVAPTSRLVPPRTSPDSRTLAIHRMDWREAGGLSSPTLRPARYRRRY